ncbi:MAG: 5-formyltetrahydrofolate cyclo-ligase [Thermoprotei archaeon ex4572_64]|nr:MAG: 5-formyltetrahydrofolate cyclo-ligase [Thermoprotei archaeon ex4572_64]
MSVKEFKRMLRERIWNLLVEKDLADFPKPPHGRVPNFKGSDLACEKVLELDEFRKANVVKINPDAPQRRCRELVLEFGKVLIMPTPRIRNGFLLLDPERIPRSAYKEASTIKGAYRWGTSVKPWNLPKIDLVIIGSVVVNLEGVRLGKGEGFAEIEWGILSELGKVNEETPVVTTVHDLQVINEEIPQEIHDVPVDIIVTPTRIIRTFRKRPKPRGMYWELLSAEKFHSIPILQELKQRYSK